MKKLLPFLLLPLLLISPTAYADPVSAFFFITDVVVPLLEVYAVELVEVALVVYGSSAARTRASRAAAEAKDRYNSNLVDRVVSAVSYNPPWRVVYGNCITGGDILAIFTTDATDTWTDGSNYTKPDGLKHLVIHIATHQISAIHDTLINGVRVGRLDSDGWALCTAEGTGVGYSISSSVQIGATVIPVAGGTGTILVGDEISFVGDNTRYAVTVGCTGPGQSVTIASPGVQLLTIAGTGINLGNEFAQKQADVKSMRVAAGATESVNFTVGRGVAVSVKEILSATSANANVDGPLDLFDQMTTTFALDTSGQGNTISTITNHSTYDAIVVMSGHARISNVRVSYHLGQPGQTVDTYLNTLIPTQWDATHTLSGMAYVVLTLNLVETTFDSGPPPIAFDVSGALVYDPRTSTTAFSNNSALVVRDFLTHNYGFSCKTADVDDSYVIAAANACDTSTTFQYIDALGTTVDQVMPLYTTNGSYTTADQPEATLTNLSLAMAGVVAYGGQYLIMPGVWTTSEMDLTDDDLDGQIEIVQAGAGLDTLFNGGHASYLPSGRTAPKDIKPYQNSAFVSADGAELWTDYTLPYTNSEVRARSIIRVLVERNRNGLVISYPAKLRAWPLRVGSRVRVTSTEYGFALKYFRVTDWQFGIGSVVALTLQEDDPTAYDQADAVQADPTPNTQLPNPNVVKSVLALVLSSGTSTLQMLGDGTIVPRVLVQWVNGDNAYVATNEVAWQLVGDNAWTVCAPVEGNETQAYVTGVAEATVIVVRVTTINSLGVRSSPVFQVNEVIGKLQPPADVAGFTVTNTAGGVQVSWTPNTELDYLETEVHIESTLVWNPLTQPIFRGTANTFVLPYPTAGTYNFLVKHRDTSGNVSVHAVSDAFVVVPASSGAAIWSMITGTGKPSDNATSDLVLIGRGNCVVTGNTGSKVGGATDWDSDVYSTDSYTGGAFVSAVAAVLTHEVMFGLNSDPTSDRNYTSLDFAWYIQNTGTAQIFESGSLVASGIALSVGDVLAVAYDGVHVTYLKNGAIVGTPTVAAAGLKLFFDSSFASPGALITNIRFGPLTSIAGVTAAAAAAATTANWATVTGAGKPADNATADLVLIARGNCVVTGNTGSKPSGASAWDSDIYSVDSYTGGAYASAVVTSTTLSLMFGLNSDPTTDQNYASLDYAWYVNASTGKFEIYENGSPVVTGFTATVGDVLAVAYDGVHTTYLQNGVVARTSTSTAGLKLFFDSSFASPGALITNIRLGPLTSIANVTAAAAAAATTANWATVTGAGKPADNATSDITLVARGGCVVAGNTASKASGAGFWDSDVYSTQSFVGGAYAQATMALSGTMMFGLNTDPLTDSNYTSLDFAWYNTGTGTLEIYESGTSVLTGLTVASMDVLTVTYDGVSINYYQNGVLRRGPVSATAGQRFYWDSSFYGLGVWSNIRLGQLTSVADVTAAAAAAATTANWATVTGTGKPADNATSDLTLIARGTCNLAGNTGTKVGGASAWDSDIYSSDSYTGGAYASAVVPVTGTHVMFGLNSDPTTDENYTSLDFAWYVSGGAFSIYESGSSVMTGITATAGDVLAVAYDGVHVTYLQNGTVVRTPTVAAAGLKLFFDSSFSDPGATITNIRFGPLTSIAGVTAAAASAATTANWATVTGIGKPADNATRNVISYQAATPTGSVNGDLWYNTTAATWETYTSGAWAIVSDVTAANIAAGIAGQGALATLNSVGTLQIDPGAVYSTVSTQSAGPFSVTKLSHTPDGPTFQNQITSLSMPSGPASELGSETVYVYVTIGGTYSMSGSSSLNYLFGSVQSDIGFDTFLNSTIATAAAGASVTGSFLLTGAWEAVGNVPVVFSMYAKGYVAGTVSITNVTTRVEVHKR